MEFSKLLKRAGSTMLALGVCNAAVPFAQPTEAAAASDKVIALTFDDGPNTTTTNEILDLLEQYDAKASFFLIGDNINEESAVSVKRAYDMGCEINNHSKTHSHMAGMTVEEIQAEVNYVDERVYEITGEYTKFFRPPFIATSQTMYDAIEQPFICGFDCKDFMADVTAEDRANAIIGNAKDGLIVLLHDAAGNDQTVEALKTVIPTLQEEGYDFVTLTELFERQGETPRGDLLYNEVAEYPCANYSLHRNVFTGEATGDASWTGWSESAVLDGAELSELSDTFAIEVEYEGFYPPAIALQKWSGASPIWQSVQPSYYNGKRACFLASDLLPVFAQNDITFTDLDRITVVPYGGTMTMLRTDILVKENGSAEPLLGDVDLNGSIGVTDLVLLQKYILNLEPLTEAQVQNADMDNSKAANGFDLAILKRKVAKM